MRCRIIAGEQPRLIQGEYWVRVLNCRNQWLDWVFLNVVPEGVEQMVKPAYLVPPDFEANPNCAVCPYVYVELDVSRLTRSGLFRTEYIGYENCPGVAMYIKSWSAGHGEGWGRVYAYVFGGKVLLLEMPSPTNEEYKSVELRILSEAGFSNSVEVNGKLYASALLACQT